MRNFDYPVPMHGRMMRQRLWETGLDARMLYETLRDTDAVPAWTTDKVAVAAHNIGQVSRYLRFKASSPQSFGAAEASGGPRVPWGTLVGIGVALYALHALSGGYDAPPVQRRAVRLTTPRTPTRLPNPRRRRA